VVTAASASCTPFRDDPSPVAADAGAALRRADAASVVTGTFAGCNEGAPFGPPTYVAGLADFATMPVGGLRLSPDYLTAYFHAPGGPGGAERNDLYTATRGSTGEPFDHIAPIAGAGINTAAYENDPAVSGDGLLLVFDRTDPAGLDHLYYAERASKADPFTLVGSVYPDAGAWSDTHPFLREDGQILYFCSDRVSAGQRLIYRAARSASGFGPPQVVAELASDATDEHPVVTPDDRTLYFDSTRPSGDVAGVKNIWVTTRADVEAGFSAPINVRELNAGYEERPSFVTRDECALFFSGYSTGDGHSTGYTAPYVASRPPL
jgi:hypothetical protein